MTVSKLTKNDLSIFELSVDYNIDIPNRRIYLSEEIDEKVSNLMIKALHYLDDKPGDIEFWITCNGGSVYHMYAIYDAIQNCDNKVVTIGTGIVGSAATLLLVCGNERYATEHTTFMAHEGDMEFKSESVSPLTLASDVESDQKLEKKYAELMADHTKVRDYKWWYKHAIENKKAVWMGTDEMKDNGVIDEVWPMI